MAELSRNEKIAGAVIATTLAGTAFTGCATTGIKSIEDYDNEKNALSLQIPTSQPEEDPNGLPLPTIEAGENSPATLKISFGALGDFETHLNYDTGMYHLGLTKDYNVKEGTKTLEDLQRDGGTIGLEDIPFDMAINVSSGSEGKFYVNDEEWDLGNPAESKDGEFVIEVGSSFLAVWEAGDDAAGLEIMISPTGSFDDFDYPETVRPNYQTEEEQREFSPLGYETNIQKLGTYKWVYDPIQEIFILQIAEKHLVKKGEMNLADLKRNGGKFVMSFPWESRLNSIVGEVRIDGKEVLNGNPVYDENGKMINKEYIIPADTVIEIFYKPDPSNGFQVEIDWPMK